MDTAVPVIAKPTEYDDSQHPHAPSGSPAGGQFTTTGGTTSNKRAPLTPTGKREGTQRSGGGGSKAAAKPYKAGGTLKRGADNDPEAVKQLQAMLGELGLGQIAVDGVFGPETENAVRAAQVKLGIKPTGTASAALQRKLHDAHTLSPCIDRGQSKVTAAAAVEESDEDELDDDEEFDEDDDLDDEDEDVDAEPVTAAAGHDITPGHDELHHYWTRGEGLAKWVDSPTPWTTLVAHLTKYVGPLKAKTFASRWFIEVFGFAAGSDLNRVTHGHPPRGKVVGPG